MSPSVAFSSSSAHTYSKAATRFAFPPGFILTPERKLDALAQLYLAQGAIETQLRREKDIVAAAAEKERFAKERAWQENLRREEQRRRKQEKRELEEALKGEKHWVRQGGVLRDADGHRDYKRTETIRILVEKEDAERRITERWEAYEDAWSNMISSDKLVTFSGIPWPVPSPPTSPDELRDPAKVGEFLFESLCLEQNRTTRRDRLRASLLRWHPDKLSGLLNRVSAEELDDVKAGIDAVVMSLMVLQESEKTRK